tara:strand:- start:973 stop:1146 length:174 start_codon:yes stop_codon:yes gene_type:complete
MFWILMLVGILVWPEFTFCIFLIHQGYPILGVVALLTTFFSGKSVVMSHYKKESSND